jgi:parallel beta-helix repeat protein
MIIEPVASFDPHPPPLVAVYGSTPTVDGTINVNEWSDAAQVSFNNTEVLVKQDGFNLYVGFNNSGGQFHADDAVNILIDVKYDGGPKLKPDDIGLVVYRNGTLFETNVTDGTWAITEISGWTAEVNSTFDLWQVEFNITYSRIDVVAGVGKTIGVVFVRYRGLEGTSPEVFSWPPSYTEIYMDASKWNAIISGVYNWGSQTIYIRADGSIDPPDAPISTVDNVTYTLTGNITSDVDGIVVERSNITIDGNGQTLEGNGGTSGIGILLKHLDNVTERNISISGFRIGVSIYTMASNNTVSENNITHCDSGIYVSFDPKILTNPNWFLFTPKYNNISENYLANNNRSIYVWRSSDNTICGNNILNSDGIYLEDASNTTITRNNVTNSQDGIFFWGVPYNDTVCGNTIVNGTRGLCCGSYNSVLRNNTMVNNRYNFVSEGTVNDVDSSNTVDGKPIYYWVNKQDMIVPLDAGHVTLVNCTGITAHNLNLTNNSPGILLWSTTNSTVTLCNITRNYEGILIQGSSSSNSISGNNIENNDYAGIGLVGSSGNSFFHNNIMNNMNETVTIASWGNIWDDGYPSGGNYWSDYDGIDLLNGPYRNETGSDGIGDTEYAIDGNNADHYPLMGMFSDFNATSECCVQTICNSSISSFQYNGTSIGFNVTGEDGTAGFCRIFIPTALMNTTYRVFVNDIEVQCNLLPCSNSTHNYLYFNYTHSTEEVVIIPEFPSVIILPLLMVLTMLAVVFAERKIPRRGRKSNC